MNARIAAIRSAETARRRCRPLADEIRGLAWEKVDRCELCSNQNIAVIATTDRYGMPVRSGLCLSCGTVFLLDRLSRDGYADFYRRWYRPLISRYSGQAKNPHSIQKNQSAYARRLAASLRPWLPSKTNGELLDIGGSTGVVSEVFAKVFGYRCCVMDPACDELTIARSKGLEVIEGTVESNNLGSRRFDLVLMCNTLDHLQSAHSSLERIGDLMSENGYFFVDIVDFDEVCSSTGCVESVVKIDHCYYFSQEVASALFPSLGWKIVNIDITVKPNHVGYLLQRVDLAEPMPQMCQFDRLKRLQLLQNAWRLAHEHDNDLRRVLLRQAYRLKKRLVRLSGGRRDAVH